MLSRNKIKHIGSLQIKKYRKIYHQFIAEGTKIVLDLIESEMEILEIYATESWINEHSKALSDSSFQINPIHVKELKQISPLTTPGNVLAVVGIPKSPFDPLLANKELVLMLDDISDPGNLRTIIRTADWFQCVSFEKYLIVCNYQVQLGGCNIMAFTILYVQKLVWISITLRLFRLRWDLFPGLRSTTKI